MSFSALPWWPPESVAQGWEAVVLKKVPLVGAASRFVLARNCFLLGKTRKMYRELRKKGKVFLFFFLGLVWKKCFQANWLICLDGFSKSKVDGPERDDSDSPFWCDVKHPAVFLVSTVGRLEIPPMGAGHQTQLGDWLLVWDSWNGIDHGVEPTSGKPAKPGKPMIRFRSTLW